MSTALVSQDARAAETAFSGEVPLSAQMFPWPKAPRFVARAALDASFMGYPIPGHRTACVSPSQEPQLSGAFMTTQAGSTQAPGAAVSTLSLSPLLTGALSHSPVLGRGPPVKCRMAISGRSPHLALGWEGAFEIMSFIKHTPAVILSTLPNYFT